MKVGFLTASSSTACGITSHELQPAPLCGWNVSWQFHPSADQERRLWHWAMGFLPRGRCSDPAVVPHHEGKSVLSFPSESACRGLSKKVEAEGSCETAPFPFSNTIILFSINILSEKSKCSFFKDQRSEKQIYTRRHKGSFSALLPSTAHVLFIYCYNHTVLIHLQHFWENNSNAVLMNLTSQHAQEAVAALNFLWKERNGAAMALTLLTDIQPTAAGSASSCILCFT